MENNAQRSRKEKILKMVKNKVHDIKVNAMKSDKSKNNLGLA